jgi:hypothetical protein
MIVFEVQNFQLLIFRTETLSLRLDSESVSSNFQILHRSAIFQFLFFE